MCRMRKYSLAKYCLVSLVALLTLLLLNDLFVVFYSRHCRWSWSGLLRNSYHNALCHVQGLSQQGRDIDSLIVQSVTSEGNVTLLERSRFQQSQVDKFCAKYKMTDQQLRLPRYRGNPAYHHLLLNSEAETLFCYVPKVGCTNLKVLYFIAQELFPESLADPNVHRGVKDALIKDIVASNSLSGIDEETCDKLVHQYFKFMMYRHPLERLASAYRSKVHRLPLRGLEDEEPHYNWLRKRIYKHTHPEQYKQWYKEEGVQEVRISFAEFISYWLESSDYRTRHDEHLMPVFDLCAPCNVRYHYYGNFASFEEDARVLVERIGTTMNNLRHGYYHRKPTETSFMAEHLYQSLSKHQKLLILERLSQDIDFYYHLFPKEQSSHKSILNITNDLIIPS